MINFNIILHLGLGLSSGRHPSGFPDSSKHSSSPLQRTLPTILPLDLMFLVMAGQGKNRECSSLSALMSLPSALIPAPPPAPHAVAEHPPSVIFRVATELLQRPFAW